MMHQEVRKKKLPFRLEVFADRGYLNTYHLAPRSQQGALLTTLSEVSTQVAQILEEGILTSLTREKLPIQADTLCFHGDNPGIMEFLPQLRKRFWK
jgi:5-oxoprolinase (ATP-hydrolysing) subunit A